MKVDFRVTGSEPGEAGGFDLVAGALAQPGWGIFHEILPLSLVQFLKEDAVAEWECGEFRRARVGRGEDRRLRPEIRSDRIQWLDQSTATPAQTEWFDWVAHLREHLNRDLFLGANFYEAHFAAYPADSRYRPHLDRPRDSDNRLVSLIVYLNESWKSGDGGELRLYTDPVAGLDGPFVDVAPELGTLAVFRSDLFWHEVLPSATLRLSLTGWLCR